MAASVYTGKGRDFAYTNNTGGNVRVIIYWLHIYWNSSEYVKLVWGDLNGTSEDYVEHIIDEGQNGQIRFGKGVAAYVEGDRAINNAYAQDSFAAPTEIFLANGHVFRITAEEDEDVKGYNVVIIPEDG